MGRDNLTSSPLMPQQGREGEAMTIMLMFPTSTEVTVTTCTHAREGYAPAAPAVRPAPHLRRVLGIIPSANKTCNSLLLDSLLFDTPSLCTLQHVLGDFFFFFELPPPPAANPCVLGLGVGVMGNAGLCSRSAHGLQVPSSFLYILVHFKGLVK